MHIDGLECLQSFLRSLQLLLGDLCARSIALALTRVLIAHTSVTHASSHSLDDVWSSVNAAVSHAHCCLPLSCFHVGSHRPLDNCSLTGGDREIVWTPHAWALSCHSPCWSCLWDVVRSADSNWLRTGHEVVDTGIVWEYVVWWGVTLLLSIVLSVVRILLLEV